METKKLFRRAFWTLGLCIAAALLAGCETERYDPLGIGPSTNSPDVLKSDTGGKAGANAKSEYHLRVGDDLLVTFVDGPTIPPVQDTIRDDGYITLIHSQRFKAVGLTIPELQTNIHDRYVSNYYNTLTANISLPNRFYNVTGEVHSPNRCPYVGPIKLLEAINSANGPTDFANLRKVKVTRDNGEQITVDCIKAQKDPKLNIWIFPGDRIDVPKGFWN